jgi:hypothetical protein
MEGMGKFRWSVIEATDESETGSGLDISSEGIGDFDVLINIGK